MYVKAPVIGQGGNVADSLSVTVALSLADSNYKRACYLSPVFPKESVEAYGQPKRLPHILFLW